MTTPSYSAPINTEPLAPRFANLLTSLLFRRRWLGLLLLLTLPLAWLVVFYLGSLTTLLAQSFFYIDDFTGQLVHQFSLQTYQSLLTPTYGDVVLRTVLMSTAVTIAAALIAFPVAYYIARFAKGRLKTVLYLAVLLPLWSSYLVRVFAWKLILANEGVINWILVHLGLGGVRDFILSLPVIGGPSLAFSYMGMFFVFLYVWLPYMILPIQAALERVPQSLIEASNDLGGSPGYTFRHILLPLAIPGIVAGSIFTFSLTLGDFIIPTIVGNSSFFIGPAVLILQGTTDNLPLAAALTVVPIAIMSVYLVIAGRLGAFEAL